jgi:hypothetical protein
MHKLIPFFFFVVPICTAQISPYNVNHINNNSSDSLVDIFPLAVGNQWEYGYDWFYDSGGPPGTGTHTDTGTVTIQVINKIELTDTTVWILKETYNLWTQFDYGVFNGPVNSADTVELIELHKGYHQLYKTGDANLIKQSVFPFFSDADIMVYRFDSINAPVIKTVHSRNLFGMSTLSFKQGIGLISVYIDDGCTCMWGYTGNHSLRSQIITSVSDRNVGLFSQKYRLLQNYPNPFNPSTIIPFFIPSLSFVSLKIFDCIGREVATLVHEELPVGNYSRYWNASNLPSGVYYYRLQSGSFTETKKFVLLK